MATHRQACAILDAVLRLPDGTARWHADRLRGAGNLPSTQGRPTQAASADVALILLSLLLGPPATSAAGLVPAYATLSAPGEPSLGDALADFVKEPADFFELKVDITAPSATLTYRGTDHGMRVTTYSPDEYWARPAFDRFAVLSADTLTRLASAIASAPPVRVGARRVTDRYRRFATQ